MQINELNSFPSSVDRVSDSSADFNYYYNVIKPMVTKYGFEQVGEGGFGTVFFHPKLPYALKLFNSDPGYTRYIGLCLQNQHNPYFPKFRGKLIKLTKLVGAVRMEKLTEFRTDPWDPNNFTIGVDRLIRNIQKTSTVPDSSPLKNDKMLIDALIKIAKLVDKYHMFFDIKDANFMMRGDQVVFTDPVAGGMIPGMTFAGKADRGPGMTFAN